MTHYDSRVNVTTSRHVHLTRATMMTLVAALFVLAAWAGTALASAGPITEDDPRWNACTMGDHTGFIAERVWVDCTTPGVGIVCQVTASGDAQICDEYRWEV